MALSDVATVPVELHLCFEACLFKLLLTSAHSPTHYCDCRQPCTNPAQVATSGFVFCYPCAFAYVTDHGCCPVTLIPASVDHVRKLYEGS